MAERVYLTREGDVVDAIAFAQYGRTEGTTEAVYEANPGLSALGPVLPAGLHITLPEAAPPPVAAPVRIWE